MADFLTGGPFHLDAEAVVWVRATREAMSGAEKVAQLFVAISMGEEMGTAEQIAGLKFGGVTRFFGSDRDAEMALLDQMQRDADTPLLVSADLEGSRMSLPFGTSVPNPLALAAVDDLDATREISRIMAEEAVALGINQSFTPVLDINAAFRSAIVATRGYGSDVARIERHAMAQAQVFQDHGIAAALKHWPGEGYDDRDQHLVTTVNPLDMDAWEASFGRLYRAGISQGVLSIMSAHIALPSFVRQMDPEAGQEAFRPASISKALNIDLLRGRLGFQGLIVSDASLMAGLTSWVSLTQSKVELIKGGCDMILFSNNPVAEMEAVSRALETGEIEEARLDDAITRILATKAALGLHKRRTEPVEARVEAIGSSQNASIAKAVTARAPTLVKDVNGLFPINVSHYMRVLIITPGVIAPLDPEPIPFVLPDLLGDEGFEVTIFEPGLEVTPDNFDLVLYLFGEETLLTRSRIFIDWPALQGDLMGAMSRYWHDIPTAMISFGYPYYLYDAPRVPAYVNAYATMDGMQEAVVDCMLGRADWSGISPVDPFCGLEDARF